jgi:hypothetical protein
MKFEDIVSSGNSMMYLTMRCKKYYQKPSQVKLAKKETVEYWVNMALALISHNMHKTFCSSSGC